MKNRQINDMACELKTIFLKPNFINLLVLLWLTIICFYLYAGFKNIFYSITLDQVAYYGGTRYVMAHLGFNFAIDFPHFFPLNYPFLWVISKLTNDTHWLGVFVSLCTHIISAFMIFRTSEIFCKKNPLSSLIAASFYLVSMRNMDSILSFPHSPVLRASFFGILSLYLFLKVIYAPENYKKKYLFLSFLFYFISILIYETFLGMILFYFLIILFKIKFFKKDFFALMFITLSFFITTFFLQKYFLQVYRIETTPLPISLDWLVFRIKNLNYSFLHLTAHFFLNFSVTLATFFHKTKTVLANGGTFHTKYYPYFSIFILTAPLLFCNKRKILQLYSLISLIYILFFPYLFSRVPLADRQISATLIPATLYIGLFVCYTFEAINKIKIIFVKKCCFILLLSFISVFFFRLTAITRIEVKKFIARDSSFSPYIAKFMQEFKSIKVPNAYKQIYYLENDIPGEYSFIGADHNMHCYYLFYLAIKYKGLPVDLYFPVHAEITSGKPLDLERCKNYFIRIPNEKSFGFYTNKAKLLKLLIDYPDISSQDVIALNRNGNLQQKSFDTRGQR
ncbi:MAG: hypothetical protein A2166_02755 [Omnitrophica WOR_2 bacterium RBG_13_41_10]|nr:MAG: hypothetical protein A2166_02755 [Omnitrophica WOR_2 bacterium RBG_13_41_10]